MEFTISWGGDPEDVAVTTEGPASVEDLDAMVRAIVDDERYRPDLSVLVDHSNARWSNLSLDDARRRAALLELQADALGHPRVAFVVSRAADYGVGRMLQLLTEGKAPIESRIFYSAAEARAWLRNPAAYDSL
jgi:hypothetical protein